jgi:beta-lactamase regulating signal transducer with metallopeptidase domain
VETLLTVGLWNAVGATVLAILAASVGRVYRRPAILHALWLLVLLKLVAPPLWSVAIPVATPLPITIAETDLPVPTLVFGQPTTQEIREDVPQPPVDQVPVFDSPPLVQALSDVNLEPDPEPLPAGRWPWLETILAVWAGGAILCWSLSALRVARFRRMLRRLCPAAEELQERVRRLAAKLGLRRGPVMYLVAAPISPMVWALTGRARLLVPQALWDGLSEAQRDLMLVHELAHLRRRDHLLRLLELVVVGLYWWFPVAWLARCRLQEAAELCCDAWVVATFPQAGEEYAATLVESASFLSQNAVPVPAGASGLGPVPLLRRRVTMILNDKIPARLSWTAVVLMLAVSATLLPLWPTRAEPLVEPQSIAADNVEAQKDLNIARFWERAGHPGSAQFYYALVKRRYPGTAAADEAETKIAELEKLALSNVKGKQPRPVAMDPIGVKQPTPSSKLNESVVVLETKFDRLDYDLGYLEPSDIVSANFGVKNISKDEKVSIGPIRVTAGAAKCTVEKAVLEPNEVTLGTFSIDTKRFKGSKPISANVSIRQGDKQATVVLQLSADGQYDAIALR